MIQRRPCSRGRYTAPLELALGAQVQPSPALSRISRRLSLHASTVAHKLKRHPMHDEMHTGRFAVNCGPPSSGRRWWITRPCPDLGRRSREKCVTAVATGGISKNRAPTAYGVRETVTAIRRSLQPILHCVVEGMSPNMRSCEERNGPMTICTDLDDAERGCRAQVALAAGKASHNQVVLVRVALLPGAMQDGKQADKVEQTANANKKPTLEVPNKTGTPEEPKSPVSVDAKDLASPNEKAKPDQGTGGRQRLPECIIC